MLACLVIQIVVVLIAVVKIRDAVNETARQAGLITFGFALTLILNFLAIIFSGIFTWGRNCGCNA